MFFSFRHKIFDQKLFFAFLCSSLFSFLNFVQVAQNMQCFFRFSTTFACEIGSEILKRLDYFKNFKMTMICGFRNLIADFSNHSN